MPAGPSLPMLPALSTAWTLSVYWCPGVTGKEHVVVVPGHVPVSPTGAELQLNE